MPWLGFVSVLVVIMLASPVAAVDLTRCRMVAQKTATLVEFEARRHDGQAITLNGVLAKPPGVGPFPAVVMLHGSSGLLTPFCYAAVAEQFVARGLVVLLPASTTARSPDGTLHLDYSFLDQIAYARAAATALSARDDVDPDRLGLWGHSRGGLTVLHGVASREAPLSPLFRTAIAAAPTCPATVAPPAIPVLLVIGANDRDISVQACTDAAKKLATTDRFRLLLLPDSGHAFWAAKAPGSNERDAARARKTIDGFLARHLSSSDP